MSETIKKISIISPCLNESQGLYKCHSAVKDLFSKKLSSYKYEHIFCDNSSSDDSKKILRKIAKEDKNAKVIGISRSKEHSKFFLQYNLSNSKCNLCKVIFNNNLLKNL